MEKWIPKFNPDEISFAKDHINTFMQAIILRNVANEDVLLKLFPYSFEGYASTWYFYLEYGFINSWDEFEKFFLQNFVDYNTFEDLCIVPFLNFYENAKFSIFSHFLLLTSLSV